MGSKKYLKFLKERDLSLDKPKTGIYKFADIDDEFLITIHHYMKWFKFGLIEFG